MKDASPAHGVRLPWRGFLRSGGFSLIELVLVMAIIGVVAAIAVPRVSGALAGERCAAAADRIASDLRRCSNLARAATRTWTMTFDDGAAGYRVTGTDAAGSAASWTVSLADEPYLATISSSFGSDSAVSFSSTGAPGENGTVRVRCGSTECLVQVDASQGTITVSRQ